MRKIDEFKLRRVNATGNEMISKVATQKNALKLSPVLRHCIWQTKLVQNMIIQITWFFLKPQNAVAKSCASFQKVPKKLKLNTIEDNWKASKMLIGQSMKTITELHNLAKLQSVTAQKLSTLKEIPQYKFFQIP